MSLIPRSLTKVRRALSAAACTAVLCTGISSFAATVALAKERFALVIDNQTYRHAGDVAFAKRDADAVERALIDTMGVPETNIWRRSNLGTTDLRYFIGAPGAPGQLQTWLANKPADAELIVYFAGHGSREQDAKGVTRPYLMGTDSRPESLQRTAYPLETMVSELQNIQRTLLRDGRVMLVLESCFSGMAGDGSELVKGRSAPAWGKPQTASKLVRNADERFIMMAAAQEDQYAVWDMQWKRSVFTDALVSGLYGEADAERFAGDGNGAVTLGELKNFVRRRVERRLRASGIQDAQVPDYIGGNDQLALVKTEEMNAIWPEQVERSHNERLESDVLLAARDVDGIKKYLGDCLYCFNRDALRTVVRETQQAQSLCAIEERWLDGIGGPTAVARLEAFLKTAKCKRLRPRTIDMIAKFKRDVRRADIAARRASAKKARLAAAERLKAERALQREEAELAREERAAERRRKAAERKAAREAQREQRLAKLTPPPKTDTPASDATAFGDETSETAVLDGAAENETGDASPIVLARRLQTELKRVGCLYGRVDGIWGRGSAAALTRFAKAQGTDITDSTPSEDLIFEVEAVAGTVCAARKIVKKPRVRKTRKVRATSKPKTRKTRTVTKPKTRTKTTYRAPKKTTPKKTYSKPKKTYTKPKRTYSSGGGGSSSPTISRQCQRYGNFC